MVQAICLKVEAYLGQEMSCFYGTLSFIIVLTKVLSQLNAIHALNLYFCNINFNNILLFSPMSPKWSLRSQQYIRKTERESLSNFGVRLCQLAIWDRNTQTPVLYRLATSLSTVRSNTDAKIPVPWIARTGNMLEKSTGSQTVVAGGKLLGHSCRRSL
jgi:hypothetical protein